MALNSRVKVPLPEKGVIVARRKGDAPRVYHVIRSYRNEKGQPTNERRLIGKLDEASGLPAFYHTYPGSIVDKSRLPYMMADNAEAGIGADGVTFVMDKGFCTTANVEYMASERYAFVVGVDGRHKATRQAVDSVRGTILSSANRLPGGVHAQAVHGRFYGATCDLHVFFDDDLARRQRLDLYRRVDADREELAQLPDLSGRDAKRLSRFHSIDVARDGSFSFAEDHAAVGAAASDSGFFCLLTNDGSLSCADVLAIYRDKGVIEKGFDELKNHLDMSRLRTHADETTEGKVFCAFVSLIAALRMQRELGPLMAKKNLTKRRVLAELEKAKVVTTASGKRLMNPLTRLQKDILAPFGVTEDDFKEFVATA